ncbi:MAG: hypothetical protein OEY89_16740 [Gammaproteobacteria bacterium]|nr:hypothetical protein [Gammaproteobacteria bacterium]
MKKQFLFAVLALISYCLLSATAGAANSILLSDNFDDGNISANWTATGNTVVEADGVLKILTNQTDNGGRVTSIPFNLPTGVLTLTRKAKLHYANSNAMPWISLAYRDESNVEHHVFSVFFGNIAYNGTGHVPVYGTFLAQGDANPHSAASRDMTVEGPPVLWDVWFDERITYDQATGEVRYFRNGSEEIVGVAPILPAETPVYLNINAWGWFTGHSHFVDDLVISADTPTPPPVDDLELEIDFPPLLEKQEFGIFGLGKENPLKLELIEVALSETLGDDNFGANNSLPGEKCYLGASDALAALEKKDLKKSNMQQLAKSIFLASIDVFPVNSEIGKFLLKFGAHMATSVALDEPAGENTIKFIVENAIGYIAYQSTESYLLGKTASQLTKKSITKLLGNEELLTWKLEGSNQGSTLQQIGTAPLTNINAEVFYSPYTHYTTVIADATCNLKSGTAEEKYILRYQVAKDGFNGADIVDDTLEVLRVPN